jgi:hypothetical protein
MTILWFGRREQATASATADPLRDDNKKMQRQEQGQQQIPFGDDKKKCNDENNSRSLRATTRRQE